jgi:hypothetical protein
VPRRLWIALGVVAAVFLAAQIVMPHVAESRIADRLTAGGGEADVSVAAFPAPRLLFGDGDELDVVGSGLTFELPTQDTNAFERLDGFGRLAIDISRSTAGPFGISELTLTRDGATPYHLVARASTTPRDLIAFGADRLGFAAGLALRFGAGQALGSEADTRVPVRLDMELESDGGRVVVVAGGGTVAGIPTGPLGELITEAIAVRL